MWPPVVRTRLHLLMLPWLIAMGATLSPAWARELDLSKSTDQELLGRIRNCGNQRNACAAVAKELAHRGKDSIEGLIGIMEDKERPYFERESARNIFAALGSNAKPFVTELCPFLESPSSTNREFNAAALGELGPAAAAAVPCLIREIKKAPSGAKDTDVRFRYTLARIGTPQALDAAGDVYAETLKWLNLHDPDKVFVGGWSEGGFTPDASEMIRVKTPPAWIAFWHRQFPDKSVVPRIDFSKNEIVVLKIAGGSDVDVRRWPLVIRLSVHSTHTDAVYPPTTMMLVMAKTARRVVVTHQDTWIGMQPGP